MAIVKLDEVTKRFGDVVAVDSATFTIDDGEFFCFVGPSGCGKTTTLRMISGLETPSEGEITFDDTVVNDVSPQNRNITMVFQDLALFPHMTVRENIGFNLILNKVSKDERNRRVREAASLVEIDDLLDRSVSELSGGQQQRVALARSVIRDPEVFLLDEPLSDLDAKLKLAIRGELQQLHETLGTTMVYVTHDQEEAMTMADRIAVMNEGIVQQIGRPQELYQDPANVFVSTFIGNPNINLFDVTYDADENVMRNALFESPVPPSAPDFESLGARPRTIGVRPEDIVLTDDTEGLVSGTVDYTEPLGSSNLIYVDTDEQQIRIRTQPDILLDDYESVSLTFNWANVNYFDEDDDLILSETSKAEAV